MNNVPPLKFDLLGFIEKGLFDCHKKFHQSNDMQEVVNAKIELGVYQRLAIESFYEIDMKLRLKPDSVRNEYYLLRRFVKGENQLKILFPRIDLLSEKIRNIEQLNQKSENHKKENMEKVDKPKE